MSDGQVPKTNPERRSTVRSIDSSALRPVTHNLYRNGEYCVALSSSCLLLLTSGRSSLPSCLARLTSRYSGRLTPKPQAHINLHVQSPRLVIKDQVAYATNLALINAFLAWVNTSLAWVNVNQAWSMVFEAWGKTFQLSGPQPEASLETNQAWIVADEPFQHRPQSRFALPQASNALPQASNALPQVSNALPQASNALPQVSCALPQASCALPQVSYALAPAPCGTVACKSLCN